ncbi:MAG: hypothetical protein ACREDR_10130 [Blastocatellia bacterium]
MATDPTVQLPVVNDAALAEELRNLRKRVADLEEKVAHRGYDTRPIYEKHEKDIGSLSERVTTLEESQSIRANANPPLDLSVAEPGDEEKRLILLALAGLWQGGNVALPFLQGRCPQLMATEIEYWLEQLIESGLAQMIPSSREEEGADEVITIEEPRYGLTKKGRDFIVEKKLADRFRENAKHCDPVPKI